MGGSIICHKAMRVECCQRKSETTAAGELTVVVSEFTLFQNWMQNMPSALSVMQNASGVCVALSPDDRLTGWK